MQSIVIDNLKIFYNHFVGNDSENTTIILHGWGASSATMQSVFNSIKEKGNSVINIDLPFFGQSDAPPQHFGIYDYADIVEKFIVELGLEKVNLLCHSFGARIAIILASKDSIKSRIKKLLLTGAAGLKPKRGLKYYIKVWLYKLKKRLKIKIKSAGSSDYSILPDNMKGVFVRVVNTNLKKYLKNISAPTLLVWGENDTDTPLYMARLLEKLIPDCALIKIPQAAHYAFLDNPQTFNAIVNAFI